MEIVRERLEREYDLSLVATAPNVEYRVHTDRRRASRSSTTRRRCRRRSEIDAIEEPFVTVDDPHADRVHRHAHGAVPERRGEMEKMEYLSPERVELVYRSRSAEIVIDFFDQLKSRTQGYASASTTSRPATARRTS